MNSGGWTRPLSTTLAPAPRPLMQHGSEPSVALQRTVLPMRPSTASAVSSDHLPGDPLPPPWVSGLDLKKEHKQYPGHNRQPDVLQNRHRITDNPSVPLLPIVPLPNYSISSLLRQPVSERSYLKIPPQLQTRQTHGGVAAPSTARPVTNTSTAGFPTTRTMAVVSTHNYVGVPSSPLLPPASPVLKPASPLFTPGSPSTDLTSPKVTPGSPTSVPGSEGKFAGSSCASIVMPSRESTSYPMVVLASVPTQDEKPLPETTYAAPKDAVNNIQEPVKDSDELRGMEGRIAVALCAVKDWVIEAVHHVQEEILREHSKKVHELQGQISELTRSLTDIQTYQQEEFAEIHALHMALDSTATARASKLRGAVSPFGGAVVVAPDAVPEPDLDGLVAQLQQMHSLGINAVTFAVTEALESRLELLQTAVTSALSKTAAEQLRLSMEQITRYGDCLIERLDQHPRTDVTAEIRRLTSPNNWMSGGRSISSRQNSDFGDVSVHKLYERSSSVVTETPVADLAPHKQRHSIASLVAAVRAAISTELINVGETATLQAEVRELRVALAASEQRTDRLRVLLTVQSPLHDSALQMAAQALLHQDDDIRQTAGDDEALVGGEDEEAED